jgi:YidC/Oxa1 family membrane protein insertase
LQAAIKSKYGITSELREGVGGIFTVEADDKMIFDNQVTFRFPEDQEIFTEIDKLKARFGEDKQKFNIAVMALYKERGISPLGGCLPMVVQIPIFYALYVALSVSVEIQNAPFICFGRLFGTDLWICDLAAHDPTYVLPILMGISMFIQQKMTPVMGDPRQAKMMLFMPVVFTFMFLNLPAGLVLYWTLSNVLQIAQQKYLERFGKKPEKAPARAAKKA